MPDKPEKLPTYEDILKELGPERMEFMTEMSRPTYKKGQGPQELEEFERDNQ
jgi:hypothetical protein